MERAVQLNLQAKNIVSQNPLEAITLAISARKYAELAGSSLDKADSFYVLSIANLSISRYEEGLLYAMNSLQLFRESKNSEKEMQALTSIAQLYLRMSDYSLSLDYSLQAISIAEELQNYKELALITQTIGNIYSGISQYDIALKYLLRSQTIYEELNDVNGIATTSSFLGSLYIKLGHFDIASNYLYRSSELFRSIQNQRGLATTLQNFGAIYVQKKQFHIALEFLAEAIENIKGFGDKYLFASLISETGIVYSALSDQATALSYLNIAVAIFRESGSREREANTLFELGKVKNTLNLFEEAIEFFTNALSILKEIGSNSNEVAICIECAKSLKAIGSYTSSIEMLERAFLIKEIVLSQEKERIISVMEQLLQIEKFEQEKEFLTKENKELADALDELKEKNESLLAAYEEIELQQHLASKTNVELESANQKLLDLNEEKNELLGIVAHDLKNIAGSISINSSNILNYFTAMTSDKLLRTTQVIKKSSDHMLEVIINLLDQNALDTGKMTLVRSSFNIVTIVDETIQLFQEHANRKKITIVFEKLVSHGQILTDRNRMKDIVSNLLSNAIKYSPIGKTVYIALNRVDTIIDLSFKDEGPGFTKKDKENLFKKYTRLSAKPTGGENSTGLGLAITKRLLEEMGGSIYLDNDYNDGALFIIKLPMA